MDSSNNNAILVPAAIVVAGALIAGGIYLSGRSGAPAGGGDVTGAGETREIAMEPVSDADHIVGPRDASVIAVEYSDIECPFCKRFHETMNRVVADTPDFAWVYRHMPLEQLHANAKTEALATECVAGIAGEDTFWAYLNRLYEVTPSNDGLNLARLPELAEEVGVPRDQFEACMDDKRYEDKVDAQTQDGIAATGGRPGTPFTVFVTNDGREVIVSGAYPEVAIRGVIALLQAGKEESVVNTLVEMVRSGTPGTQIDAFMREHLGDDYGA